MSDVKNLTKRYLIWLYKTNKEALERIDRKFTQLDIDCLMLKSLEGSFKKNYSGNIELEKLINEFKDYIINKEKESASLKFIGNSDKLKPNYIFLQLKVIEIEKIIKEFFGKATLNEIKKLYYQEMFERILKEKEHK